MTKLKVRGLKWKKLKVRGLVLDFFLLYISRLCKFATTLASRFIEVFIIQDKFIETNLL